MRQNLLRITFAYWCLANFSSGVESGAGNGPWEGLRNEVGAEERGRNWIGGWGTIEEVKGLRGENEYTEERLGREWLARVAMPKLLMLWRDELLYSEMYGCYSVFIAEWVSEWDRNFPLTKEVWLICLSTLYSAWTHPTIPHTGTTTCTN